MALFFCCHILGPRSKVSSQGTQACILAHNAVLLTATGLASGVVFLVFLELLRGTVSWTRGATD